MKGFLTALGGGLFGAGLAISGMTNPEKVIGFLDFFGEWDPALAFVMAGAVAAFGLGRGFLRRHEGACRNLPDTSSDPLDRRMLIGSAIFGVGWGLGGYCPGPAIASLGIVRVEALVFLVPMILGMIVAQRVFGLDR